MIKTIKKFSRGIELYSVAEKIKFKQDVYFSLNKNYSDSRELVYSYDPDLLWKKRDRWDYSDLTVSKIHKDSTLYIKQEDKLNYLAFDDKSYYIVPKVLVSPHTRWDALIDYLDASKEVNLFIAVGLAVYGIILAVSKEQLPFGGFWIILWIILFFGWIYQLIINYHY